MVRVTYQGLHEFVLIAWFEHDLCAQLRLFGSAERVSEERIHPRPIT